MTIRVEFQETGAHFPLGFEDESRFELGFEEGFSRSPNAPYAGDYEVTPKIADQRLLTHDRWLSRDVVVKAIPYYEVENVERGTTAIIGG